MIVEKNFLNKLKDLNINSYEAKIWMALLSRGVSSAGELSEISNVPRSRSYDVLENLERKGFIVMKIGKPIKYIALPPKDVLERVKKNIKEDADREIDVLDRFKSSEVFKELETLHNKGINIIDPLDLSGILKGRSNIYAQLNLLINNAEKEIMIMTTVEGLKRKKENFMKSLKRAASRGVKISIIAPSINSELAAGFEDISKIRQINSLKARIFITDSRQSVFMLKDDPVDEAFDLGLWINSPFMTSSLKDMFELAWKNSKKLSTLKTLN